MVKITCCSSRIWAFKRNDANKPNNVSVWCGEKRGDEVPIGVLLLRAEVLINMCNRSLLFQLFSTLVQPGRKYILKKNIKPFHYEREIKLLQYIEYKCICVEMTVWNVGGEHETLRFLWLLGRCHPRYQKRRLTSSLLARLGVAGPKFYSLL